MSDFCFVFVRCRVTTRGISDNNPLVLNGLQNPDTLFQLRDYLFSSIKFIFLDMDHEQDEDTEAPPFALSGTCVSRHLFRDETIAHFSPSLSPTQSMVLHNTSMFQPAMTTSPESSAPGLMASMVTTSTSSGSDSSLIHELASTTSQMGTSSAYLLSSLPSISSVTRADSSQQISGSESMTEDHKESSRTTEQFHTSQRPQESLTFSQLMREIDVHETSLRASRMSVVPEEELMEDLSPGGTLISSPNTSLSFDTNRRHQIAPRTLWLPNVFSPQNISGPNSMEDPLLVDQGEYDSRPLVPTSPSDAHLERALSSVRAMIDTDDSFEVSMELPMGGTVESVMNILANPELLPMWCDPVQSLVVTSSSDGNTTDEGSAREYEAEWIEATTTALDPPSSSLKYIQTTGQAVLDAMGFPSYGKISMFIERRTGRVGLTLGPFSGGIHAAHHIHVSEVRGKLCVVDRVRLSRNAEEASSFSGIFTCGLLDSCLSPPLKSYMEQVSTSLARLRLLVESGEISVETEVVRGAP